MAVAAVLTLVLMLPGIINRGPLLFPDSLGYYHAGEAAAGEARKLVLPPVVVKELAPPKKTLAERQSDNISTARSVYYGFAFWLAYQLGGPWGLPLLQALVTALSLALAIPHLFGEADRRAAWAIAGVAALSGLGAFAVAIMPDLFGGLMILALAVLLMRWEHMRPGERCYWLLLTLAACLFHKANVALASALIGLYVIGALVHRRLPLWNAAALGATVLTAFVAHASVAFAVERLTGKPTVEVPFILARLIGDRTAERFLRRRCPDAGYALCRHLDRFPMTENEFLWSPAPERGLLKVVPPQEAAQISREAPAVVVETVQAFPIAQLAVSSRNSLRQFVSVGVDEFDRRIDLRPGASAEESRLVRANNASAVSGGTMPLAAISAIMTVTYLAAIAALALALPVLLRRGADHRLGIVVLLVTGAILNALISGVISGVFARYQGRVAWVVIVAALIAVFLLRERKAEPAEDDQANVVPLDVTTRSRAAR